MDMLAGDIFTWHDVYMPEQNCIDYYKAILKVPFDKYNAGAAFEMVSFDFKNGTLSVWEEGNETSTPDGVFKLTLLIDGKVSNAAKSKVRNKRELNCFNKV